jgi:hypothetical protein
LQRVKCSALQITYRDGRWTITAKPVSTGWPARGMVVLQWYLIATGPTLADAIKAALAWEGDAT